MADRVLFMGWGEVTSGREERALEVFNEALGILGRKQQEGAIEGFDVVILGPNGGELDGYMQVTGTLEQITALQEDPEFQANTADAQLIVNGMRHFVGYANEGVARIMGVFQEAVAKVPQTT